MKRIGLIALILISCIAVMTSCSDDPKKKFFAFTTGGGDGDGDGDGDGGGDEVVFEGPASVVATDGDYMNKVGVNWGTVSEAVSYNIYRAASEAGPFETKIAAIDAADLVNADTTVVSSITPDTVSTTATGGTCDVPVYQASYQSARNIGDGIFVMGGIEPLAEHYTIEVIIGGSSKGVAHFSGGLLGKRWTQTMIVNEFNRVLGPSGTCYPVTQNGNKYIKIVSSQSIRLKNAYDIAEILWVPLKFINSSATWDSEYFAEREMIACNDTTAPTVTLTSPAGGATNIALNAKLSVAFSEPITQSTLNDATFTLTAGGSPVEGTVSSTGEFTPTEELISNTEYTATITTGVTDLAGNPLASNYVWTFTTSASGTVSYYYVDTEVTKGNHYYYVVTAVDKDGNESEMSPVEEGFTKADERAPSKVPSCSASDGQNGRITVTWGAATGATYYKVYRVSGGGQVQVGGNITDLSNLSYSDTNINAGIYYYKVAPFNEFGEGGSSDKDPGFRAATDYEFFDFVYAEEESALGRIEKLAVLMNPNSSWTDLLDAMGSETIYDLNGTGKCVYNASTDYSSATVTISFTDYCDFFLHLSGTQTTDADTSANGTTTGQLNVTGIYSGYVKFNLTLTGGTTSSGNYTVSQNGGSTETTIPYSYVPSN